MKKKKRFSFSFKFKTLKKKLFFFLTIGALLSFLLISIVSYNVISSIQKNKVNSSISLTLDRVTKQLDRDYYNILQITQQMMPEGYVGSELDEYFFTTDAYNKSVKSRLISNNLELLCSYPNVVLSMYYDNNNNTTVFSNLPPVVDYNTIAIPEIKNELGIQYHTFHESVYKFSKAEVVSVRRSVIFSNDQNLEIYAEVESDIEKYLNEFINAQQMTCVFVQLKNNKVYYSSHPGLIEEGSILDIDEENYGIVNDYIWNKSISDIGFSNVLLVPESEYNRDLQTWSYKMLIIVIVVLVMLSLIMILLYRTIYSPINRFEKEMTKFGEGDMRKIDHNTGVEEFDQMFRKFNLMKTQIQSLMDGIEREERQRHALEIEQLYYKINPHFLMNALNSAKWLANMSGAKQIGEYISTLNYILSYSLGKVDHTTTLKTELKMLEKYIKLQQNRYDFEIEINIEEGKYLNTHVPRLLLQPLAENAICHGMNEGGVLSISITHNQKDETAIIEIEDNGRGLEEKQIENIKKMEEIDEESFGKGIGLRYVYLVLESFYGNKDIMKIESKKNEGTKVKIVIPITKIEE